MTSRKQSRAYAGRVWGYLRRILEFGHARQQVFDDWLELSLAAHLSLTDNYSRKGTFPGRLDGPYEARYNAIMSRYPQPRANDAFVSAYEALADGVERCRDDVLGELHQFIYPRRGPAIASPAMTHLLEAMRDQKRTPTNLVVDYRCGSGRMLIEAGRLNPQAELRGYDRDEVSAKVCALNMVVFGFKALVKHGDVATGEYDRCWRMLEGFVAEADLRNKKNGPPLLGRQSVIEPPKATAATVETPSWMTRMDSHMPFTVDMAASASRQPEAT